MEHLNEVPEPLIEDGIDKALTTEPTIATDDNPLGTDSLSPGSMARSYRWIDFLLVVLLVVISVPWFYVHAGGDLYSDEADYALASMKGFSANRLDRSDRPSEPNRLIAMRHYHAPLTADMIGIARQFGTSDHTIRMPFMLAGGLSVALTYLCALALFDRRREIGIAGAALVLAAPPFYRFASHALPWSLIIVELLFLLWTLTQLVRSRKGPWLVAAGVGLGLLFVTSEVFFVALPAVFLSVAAAVWPDRRNLRNLKPLAGSAGIGLVALLAVPLVIWPAGLTGSAVKMLRHYMEMRHSENFPVNIDQAIYQVAPKWAYLYWYWSDYKPFFVCYAAGIIGLIGLALFRRLNLTVVPLLSFTVMLLFAAHRAHIIGPEYLGHCLPFLTLVGGYAAYALGTSKRLVGAGLLLLLAVPVVRWRPHKDLPGMNPRSQLSRWPEAARYLGTQWKSGDRITVGSQPVSVARWYLVTQGRVPSIDTQFQTLPVHAPKPIFLERLSSGFYEYVAVSNMVEDVVDLDPKTAAILRASTVIWRSDEHGTGPSRLTIYRTHPLQPPPGQGIQP